MKGKTCYVEMSLFAQLFPTGISNNLDDGKPLVLLNIPMSTGLNAKDQYVALSSYPPPPRHSHDSDDSLRALEISEGPATNPQRIGRCIFLSFPSEWS